MSSDLQDPCDLSGYVKDVMSRLEATRKSHAKHNFSTDIRTTDFDACKIIIQRALDVVDERIVTEVSADLKEIFKLAVTSDGGDGKMGSYPLDSEGVPSIYCSPHVRLWPTMVDPLTMDKVREREKEDLPCHLRYLVNKKVVSLVPSGEVADQKFLSSLLKTKKGRYVGLPTPGIYERRVLAARFNNREKIEFVIVGATVSPVMNEVKDVIGVKVGDRKPKNKTKLHEGYLERHSQIPFAAAALLFDAYDQSRMWKLSFSRVPNRIDLVYEDGELGKFFSGVGRVIFRVSNPSDPVPPGFVRGPKHPECRSSDINKFEKQKIDNLPVLVIGEEKIVTENKPFAYAHIRAWEARTRELKKRGILRPGDGLGSENQFDESTPFIAIGANLEFKDFQFQEGITYSQSINSMCEDNTFGGYEPYPALEQLGIYCSEQRETQCDCTICDACLEWHAERYLVVFSALLCALPYVACNTEGTKGSGKASVIGISDQYTSLCTKKARCTVVEGRSVVDDLKAWLMLSSGKGSNIEVSSLISDVIRFRNHGITNGYGISVLDSAERSPFENSLERILKKNAYMREVIRSKSNAPEQPEEKEEGEETSLTELVESYSMSPFSRVGRYTCYHEYGFLSTPKVLSAAVYCLTMLSCTERPVSIIYRIVPDGMKVGFKGLMGINDAGMTVTNRFLSRRMPRTVFTGETKNEGIVGSIYPADMSIIKPDLYLDPDSTLDKEVEEILVKYPCLVNLNTYLLSLIEKTCPSLLAQLQSNWRQDAACVIGRRFSTPYGYFVLPLMTVCRRIVTWWYRMVTGVPYPHPIMVELMAKELMQLSARDPTVEDAVKTANQKSAGRDSVHLKGKKTRVKGVEGVKAAAIAIKINQKGFLISDLGFNVFLEEQNWWRYGTFEPLMFAFRTSVNAKFRLAYLNPIFWIIPTRSLAESMEKGRTWETVTSALEYLSFAIEKVRALWHDLVTICADGSNFDAFGALFNIAMSIVLIRLKNAGKTFGTLDRCKKLFDQLFLLLGRGAMMFQLQKGDSSSIMVAYDGNPSGLPITTHFNMLIMVMILKAIKLLDDHLAVCSKQDVESGAWVEQVFPNLTEGLLKKPDFSLPYRDSQIPLSLHSKNVHSWGDDSAGKSIGYDRNPRAYTRKVMVLYFAAFLACGMSIKRSATLVSRYAGNYIQKFKHHAIGGRARSPMAENPPVGAAVLSLAKLFCDASAIQLSDRGFSRAITGFYSLISKRCKIKHPSGKIGYYSLTFSDAVRCNLLYPHPFPRLFVDCLLSRNHLKDRAADGGYADLEPEKISVGDTEWSGTAEIGGEGVPSYKPMTSAGAQKDFLDRSTLATSLAMEAKHGWGPDFYSTYGYQNLHLRKLKEVMNEKIEIQHLKLSEHVEKTVKQDEKGEAVVSHKTVRPHDQHTFSVVKSPLPSFGYLDVGRMSRIVYEGIGGEIRIDDGVISAIYEGEVLPSPFPITDHIPMFHACEINMLDQIVFGQASSRLRIPHVWGTIEVGGVKFSQESLISLLSSQKAGAIKGWSCDVERTKACLVMMGFPTAMTDKYTGSISGALMSQHLGDHLQNFSQSTTEVMLGSAMASTIEDRYAVEPLGEDEKYRDTMRVLLKGVLHCALVTLVNDEYMTSSSYINGERCVVDVTEYLSGSKVLGRIPKLALRRRA
jgi:hypothetical protein